VGLAGLTSLDNYLKGTGDGSGGADVLALEAPATILCLDDNGNVVNQHDSITMAYGYAKPTSVALFRVYLWHFRQFHKPPPCLF